MKTIMNLKFCSAEFIKSKLCQMALLVLTVLVISGCGQKSDTDGNAVSKNSSVENIEPSEQDTIVVTARREPPDIELCPVEGEGDSLLVRSCGYNWNWPEGEDQMGSSIADSAAPLSEGAPWDTLILSENGADSSEYRLTIRVDGDNAESSERISFHELTADEIGIDMWNLADVGNTDAAADRVAVYQYEEIAAEDFSIPLQADKVYEIYLIYDKEKMNENGCFGIAYYVFKTE